MDTTTIILVAVIVVGLALIVVVRMLRSHHISSSQTLDNDPTYSPFLATSTDSNPDVDIQQVALRFLSKGQKIEAIKRVREATGWGLKEAKDYVDALATGSSPPAPFRIESVESVPDAVRDMALTLIRDGRKIEAIKVVREHTNWGLKEAKDWVDAVESDPSYRTDW